MLIGSSQTKSSRCLATIQKAVEAKNVNLLQNWRESVVHVITCIRSHAIHMDSGGTGTPAIFAGSFFSQGIILRVAFS